MHEINEEIKLHKKRSAFEQSEDGVKFVSKSELRLESIINEKIKEFEAIESNNKFHVKRSRDQISVTVFNYRLTFELDTYASNSITGATLTVYLQNPPNRFSEKSSWTDVNEYIFKPTLDTDEIPKWFLDNKAYTLEEIVSFTIDDMAEKSFKDFANYTKTGKF